MSDTDQPKLSAFEQSVRDAYAQSWLEDDILIQETSKRICEQVFGEVPNLPLRAIPERIWPLVRALINRGDADLDDIDEC